MYGPAVEHPSCVGDINTSATTAPTNHRCLFPPPLCVPGMADTPTHSAHTSQVSRGVVGVGGCQSGWDGTAASTGGTSLLSDVCAVKYDCKIPMHLWLMLYKMSRVCLPISKHSNQHLYHQNISRKVEQRNENVMNQSIMFSVFILIYYILIPQHKFQQHYFSGISAYWQTHT